MKKKQQDNSIDMDYEKNIESLMKKPTETSHMKEHFWRDLQIVKDKRGKLWIIDYKSSITKDYTFSIDYPVEVLPFALPEKMRKIFENELRDGYIGPEYEGEVEFSIYCYPKDIFAGGGKKKGQKNPQKRRKSRI
jgi:hypothetical protein